MKFCLFLFLFFIWITSHSQVDSAVAVTGDYAQTAMTELASTPPLFLLKNEAGKQRYGVVAGYLKLRADDTSLLSDGTNSHDDGKAEGFGLGFGYSKSFKERWSYFGWIQAAYYSGSNIQSNQASGVVLSNTEGMTGTIVSLSAGVSYEFLRNSENHTLNVFGGPSLIKFDSNAAITTFNSTTATPETRFNVEILKIIPAVTLGAMYEYRYFQTWRFTPYTLIVLSLAGECTDYEASNISLNLQAGQSSGSSPECEANTSGVGGEVDIAPSFFSFGVKVKYVPWSLGFNISSFFRNAIINAVNGTPTKTEVEGIMFSLSKDWGDD